MYIKEYNLSSEKRRVCHHKNYILDLVLKKSRIFKIAFLYVIFCYEQNKLSSHMTQISQHINSTNEKNHSYNKTINCFVTIDSNKCDNNDNSYPQLYHIQNSVLMRIVDIPENNLSHVEGKEVTRKLCTYVVNSYSTSFSCSARAMYNRVHRAQKK